MNLLPRLDLVAEGTAEQRARILEQISSIRNRIWLSDILVYSIRHSLTMFQTDTHLKQPDCWVGTSLIWEVIMVWINLPQWICVNPLRHMCIGVYSNISHSCFCVWSDNVLALIDKILCIFQSLSCQQRSLSRAAWKINSYAHSADVSLWDSLLVSPQAQFSSSVRRHLGSPGWGWPRNTPGTLGSSCCPRS